MTTTSSAGSAVASSLSSALGISSGIDTSSLVSQLVAATRDPKESYITTKQTTNNARISALASAKSSLATFSSALTQLLKSTDYSGQPASSNATIASVALTVGATESPKGLPAQLQVNQLATAQSLSSATMAIPTTTDANGKVTTQSAGSVVAGTGTLTFTSGPVGNTKSFSVTLSNSANTLDDLAKAINTQNGGISASVVSDSTGARLVLKGSTGVDQAFTVSAGTDADSNLARFAYAGSNTASMSKTQSAQNAKITLDGMAMEFATNTVKTAIPNLTIELNEASSSTVTLATNQPTATMEDLVGEFVSAYNNLKSAINDSTKSTDTTVGLLSSDSGIRDMSTRLAKLTSTQLASTGTYKTLADLGVSTNRDGTLTLDSDRLKKALEADPEGVTQMLNPTTSTTDNPGIAGALKTITDYLNADSGPLASSAAVYDKMKTSLADQLTKLDTDMSNYSDQLTKTYSAMQTQLLAFKSTQSYLQQQIDAWNKSN